MLTSIINIIVSYYSPYFIMALGVIILTIIFVTKRHKLVLHTSSITINKNFKNDNVYKIELTNDNPPLDKDTLNKDLEPYGFAYDDEQDIFYSVMYPWQRQHGYCKSYDLLSPFMNLIFDSEPIYFKYDNRRWLIEFWKGQYGMTTGGEVGIYVSNKDISDFPDLLIYDSVTDDEMIPMSFTLKKNGQPIINRSGKHWWLTGFKLGMFSKPSQLSMDITITLKDEKMRNAFIDGLKRAGYKENELSINNNSVSLIFDKPRSIQPFTLNKILVAYAQSTNKHNCNIYNFATRHYNNSLDKLNFIKQTFPSMYERVLSISKKV